MISSLIGGLASSGASSAATPMISGNAAQNTLENAAFNVAMQDWQQMESQNKSVTDAANNVSKMWSDSMKQVAGNVGQ